MSMVTHVHLKARTKYVMVTHLTNKTDSVLGIFHAYCIYNNKKINNDCFPIILLKKIIIVFHNFSFTFLTYTKISMSSHNMVFLK